MSKPATRFRTRKRVDMSRVGVGLKGPGMDTRTWIAMARVDVDPDATVWDPELGWLVDVTIVGGPLDGESEVLCRWPSSGQRNGSGRYDPPHQGALVIVAIPSGDINDDCIILGELHNEDAMTPSLAATSINDVSIVEAFAARTHMQVFPTEDLDAQYANVRITGQMVLGVANADQPFARGVDLANAIGAFADAISTFIDSVTVGSFGNVDFASFAAAGAVLKSQAAQFKAARDQYLSTTIRGT